MTAFYQATPDDAEQIADIVIDTSGGIVERLFDGLIPDVTPQMVLSAAFVQGEGQYKTENVICLKSDDTIAGLLFSYTAEEHKIPSLMESMLPSKRLAPVRPILERSIPDSLYISTIWVDEALRGEGYADLLMLEAVSRCRALGLNKISLFCWNDNERALRFYARKNFTLHEHLPPELIRLKGHPLGGSLLILNLLGK